MIDMEMHHLQGRIWFQGLPQMDELSIVNNKLATEFSNLKQEFYLRFLRVMNLL